jgi:extradiol dioxygenase family protein
MQKNEVHNVDMGNVSVPHFGVHFDADVFKSLKEQLIKNNIEFLEEPYIRFEGKDQEQETMFIEDPNGNVLELKTMINPNTLFGK